MTHSKTKILIYGYGNPGRQDDGLGVLLAEEIDKWAREHELHHIRTESDYQLNLEDTAVLAEFDKVIFADASQEKINHFLFEPLVPSGKVEFTMHSVSPGFLMYLCGQLFNKCPEAFLLHIKGYEWEFMDEMTGKAQENLKKAVDFIKSHLEG